MKFVLVVCATLLRINHQIHPNDLDRQEELEDEGSRESSAYVQRQLGRASIQLTVTTYGKWFPLGNKAAVNRLDSFEDLIGGSREVVAETSSPLQDCIHPLGLDGRWRGREIWLLLFSLFNSPLQESEHALDPVSGCIDFLVIPDRRFAV